MIIVNQKKDIIINFNNVANINVERCCNESLNEEDFTFDIYAFIVSSGLVRLGKYKTEKRAIEVLVEIATAYTNMEIINIPVINIHENISAQRMAKNICYEMPEE